MNQENDDKNTSTNPVEPVELGPKEAPVPRNTDELDRLTRVLSEVDPGWKIAIMRVAPSWCRGHLETYEVYDPSESVDVNYLIRHWGGHKLHLKVHNERGHIVGGGSIALYSYPPRVHGRLIEEDDYFAKNPVVTQVAPIVQQQPAASAGGIDIMQLLSMLQKGNKNELELAMKILDRAPSAPAQQIGNIAEQMTAMFGLLSQFREMFAAETAVGGGGGGDNESILPMVGDLVKGLMSMNQQKQLVQSTSTIQPPRQSPPIPINNRPKQSPPPDPSPARAAPRAAPRAPLNMDNAVDYLASLDSSDISSTIVETMKNLPREKRDQALTHLMIAMRDNPFLDDLENIDDTFSQDEDNEEHYDYYEPEDHQDSFRDEFEPGPDETNHPPDRPSHPKGVDLPTDPQPRGIPGNPRKA